MKFAILNKAFEFDNQLIKKGGMGWLHCYKDSVVNIGFNYLRTDPAAIMYVNVTRNYLFEEKFPRVDNECNTQQGRKISL